MASMTGAQPIEYYYPAGFGELNIVEQDESLSSVTGDIQWLSPAILNKSYNETSPSRPIYEQQKVIRPQDPDVGCRTNIQLRASYVSYVGAPPTTGGDLKFAIVSGVFPPSLTLDIDTGYMFGKIDDLDDIFPEEFGLTNPQGIPEDPRDVRAAQTFNFNFGEQGPRKFTEDNYAVRGSASLYRAGFPIPKGIIFIARAFDSSLTSRYIDGEFMIDTSNNWSSDRDEFILNIRNQMFIDGQPVTNKQYLATMKERGYFPNC
jgi:hypothetical protein